MCHGVSGCNMRSQLLGQSDILKSLRIQVSANILQLVFNTVDTPNRTLLLVSILNKSHFCLVGKSIGACRARFEFWLHHLTGNKILWLLSLISFLIFKCGDKNLPYFTEFPEARMIPKVRNCFVNDPVCHK